MSNVQTGICKNTPIVHTPQTHTQTHTRIRTHKHTRTNIHRHTHRHTHTQTHTHAQCTAYKVARIIIIYFLLGLRLDAQAAMNFLLHCQDIDRSKIILFGQSLGGAVAIDLASNTTCNDK